MFEDEKLILFNALIRSLDEKSNKILELSLNNAGAEVSTTILGYIANKLPTQSKWKAFPKKAKMR